MIRLQSRRSVATSGGVKLLLLCYVIEEIDSINHQLNLDFSKQFMILRNFEMWFTSMDEMFCSSVEEEDVEGRIFHRILFGLNFLNVSHFLNIMLK